MQIKEHKLSKKAQTAHYIILTPLSVSGALKAFYEWYRCHAEYGSVLLQSSTACNLMQITQEMCSEGLLHNDMLCLNETIKGVDRRSSYGKVLQELIVRFDSEKDRSSDETLCKVVLLTLQASLSDFEGPDFWIHMRGLSSIINDRGPRNYQTYKARSLLRVCRTSLLYMQMFSPRESCFQRAPLGRDHGFQVESTDMDTLVDYMNTVSTLMRDLSTLQPGDDETALTAEVHGVLIRMNAWFEEASKRIEWAVHGLARRIASCPLDSFLIFADPLSAEICLMYYTILLILADFMESRSSPWWTSIKVARNSPPLDTFTLSYDVARMVPYFLAGGVLGYFTVNFPARFALRCFARLRAVRHEKWLSNVVRTVRLAPLDTKDFFFECPAANYTRC